MAQRDETRFADLYDLYRSQVWLYCRRRVGVDQADDVMGDVFLAAWRRIGDAPPPADALPWLYRISYLTVANHWRSGARRRRLKERLTSLGVAPAASVVDQVVVRDTVREVVALLDELRPRDAEVLRLAAWEGLSTDQIGAVLELSPDAAKQRLSRARRRLADMHERRNRPIRQRPTLLRREVRGE